MPAARVTPRRDSAPDSAPDRAVAARSVRPAAASPLRCTVTRDADPNPRRPDHAQAPYLARLYYDRGPGLLPVPLASARGASRPAAVAALRRVAHANREWLGRYADPAALGACLAAAPSADTNPRGDADDHRPGPDPS